MRMQGSPVRDDLIAAIPDLPRRSLIGQLEAPGPRLRLIVGPVGAGKSRLLRTLAARHGVPVRTAPPAVAERLIFLDVPHERDLVAFDADVAGAAERIFVALRPDQRIEGMARLRMQDGEIRLGPTDLAFDADDLGALPDDTARHLLQDFACWPSFLRCAFEPNAAGHLAAYFRETLLTAQSAATVTGLSLWLDAPDRHRDIAACLLPPAFVASPKSFPLLCEALRSALDEETARRCTGEELVEIANTLVENGRALPAMDMLLDHGLSEPAARILERAEGRELIYQSSSQAFQRTVMRFPPQIVASNETVLLCVGKALLKRGELARTRALMGSHLGTDFLDPLRALAVGSRYSFEARTFRLNMMICEDFPPGDTMLSRLAGFMADYPVGDDAKWAAYYNALLEFEIRRRHMREAEGAAARALIHLERIGERPVLEFFIHFHRVVLRLLSGDAIHAQRACRDAAAALERFPHDAPSEHRMLAFALACLAYEAGDRRPFIEFLECEFDNFAAGEIWPSMMQCALHYACEAFAAHYPIMIRPGCLDGFWIHLLATHRFRPFMEIRMARLLQNANRWNDAVEVLQALRLTIGRTWVEAAVEDLAHLSGRDEVAYAMVWLRDAIHGAHQRSYLVHQITTLMACPVVMHRDRAVLQLWLAFLHRRLRDTGSARVSLTAALTSIHRLGCYGVLIEEKPFTGALLNDRRLTGPIESLAEFRACRKIFNAEADTPVARAIRAGLSPREVQLLGLIAEGLSNKRIAHSLDIREPTVKYHLGNLYRKLGCRGRKQAVASAKALDWL
ncbi:LuxR C-terminal-related transcriptional regulator [Pararhizobium mangrovi]|nr:LuxR C-terminal-related transcriptional regulator [Pararhizobium mangrovi]